MAEPLVDSPPAPRKRWTALHIVCALGLFSLALVVRFAVVWPLTSLESSTLAPRFPIEDDREYHESAREFVTESDGRLPVWRPPGYVLFCAPAYLIDPENGYRWVWFAQSLLGSFSCVLLMLVVWRLSSFGIGLIAGILYALQLEAVIYCSRLMRETVFVFLWLLLAWVGLRKPEEISYPRAFLIGILAVPLVFTRPEGVALVGVLFLWLLWQARRSLLPMLGKSLVVLAVLAPFVVWNGFRVHKVEGTFAPLGLDGPGLLYVGNNPNTGNWGYFHEDPRARFEELKGKPHGEKNRFLIAKTLEYVLEEPTSFLKGLVYKTKILLFGTYKYWQASAWTLGEDLLVLLPPLVRFPLVGYGFLLITACFGFLRWPRGWGWGMIGLWMLTYFLIMVLVASFSRGRVSLLPFLSAFAAWGLAVWWRPVGCWLSEPAGSWPAIRNLGLAALILFAAWNSRWITGLFDFAPPPVDIVWSDVNGRMRYLEVQTDVGTRIQTWMDGKLENEEVVDSWNGKKKLTLPMPDNAKGDVDLRFSDPSGNTSRIVIRGYDRFRLDQPASVEAADLQVEGQGITREMVLEKNALSLEPGASAPFRVEVVQAGTYQLTLTMAGKGPGGGVIPMQVELDGTIVQKLEVPTGEWSEVALEFPLNPGLHLVRLSPTQQPPPTPTPGWNAQAALALSVIRIERLR